MPEYAALVASPRALPDGLILVFQHPVRVDCMDASDTGCRQLPFPAWFINLMLR